MQNILVPPLGESIAEASIKSLKKRVGESVKQDDLVALLETDKVTIEITAPCDGVIASLNVKEGDSVVVGALIAVVDGSKGSTTLGAQAHNVGEGVAVSSASIPLTKVPEKNDSPVAKLMMQEMGIKKSEVDASGKDGRVTKEDVLKFHAKQSQVVEGSAPSQEITSSLPLSNQDINSGSFSVSKDRGERVERMSKLRQKIAQRLKESQNTAAILTTFNEINMTSVIALRIKYKDLFEKKHGTKLGFMSFFVRASVMALEEFPVINAEIRGNDIIFKSYFDIGVAVGTENGLVVPVIRNSESLSIPEIERVIADLGSKAKDGKLLVKDMEGGTFTITNGGIYGSLMSTPILNPPQSGILGMHAVQNRPVVNENGEIVACPMMYVALSYDHRIVDGREAVSFLVKIKNYVENPERLMLGV